MTASPIRVDIVSDVVCPWCIVGYRQLARASKAAQVDLEIHWHPFELNPHMPPEGENLRDHLAAKYGITPEASRKARERLTALGRELGFTFTYSDNTRMVNTFKAHQLIDWASSQARGHDMKLALFAAYFTDNRDVSDTAVLVDVAASLDLDPVEARSVLDTGALANRVRAAQSVWIERGIQGVPAMVFQSKYLVTGAQGAETYGAILDRLQHPEPAE